MIYYFAWRNAVPGCRRTGAIQPRIQFAIRRARPSLRHEFNIRNNIRTCFDTDDADVFLTSFYVENEIAPLEKGTGLSSAAIIGN